MPHPGGFGLWWRGATNRHIVGSPISWVIRGKLIASQAGLERGDAAGALEMIQSFGNAVLTSEQAWQLQVKIAIGVSEVNCLAFELAKIDHLNPIIRGWSAYFSAQCSKDAYSKQLLSLFNALTIWVNYH